MADEETPPTNQPPITDQPTPPTPPTNDLESVVTGLAAQVEALAARVESIVASPESVTPPVNDVAPVGRPWTHLGSAR